MNILLTGATGYTGRGLSEVLASRHHVRGADIADKKNACQEFRVADITQYEVCLSLVEGLDALVLCHMAPNPHGYKTPPLAFDINAKGTANLYHAAQEAGLKKVVMVSTCGVLVDAGPHRDAAVGVGPYNYGKGLYVLTKIMQEGIALHYFKAAQIATAVLRPGWIVYDGELITKYGEKMERYYSSLLDPRDIGTAALAALDLPDLGLEAFNIGQDDYVEIDGDAARTRLRWAPTYRFASLPRVADS
jgi:nucleoside-diphosphate-sugar epimerase